MERNFDLGRFLQVLEEIFLENGAEVLDELEKEGLLDKAGI